MDKRCPNCATPFPVSTQLTNVTVCACGKVWRLGKENKIVSDIAVITNAQDCIQPGTTGRWQNQSFTVTGRFRLWSENEAYNYWTILSEDQTKRYLAEGYGMYEIYEQFDDIRTFSNRDFANFKRTKRFSPELPLFEIIQTGKTTYLDVEGSFFIPSLGKDPIECVEAMSVDDRIEIIKFGDELLEIYKIHLADFDSLFLENLRPEPGPGRSFTCRKCSESTVVHTFPYTQSWVCCNCTTRYSFADGTPMREYGKDTEPKPPMYFQLGNQLTLFDINYEVIGFAHKKDPQSKYDEWSEYVLYNGQYGYAFLNESDGHWLLVRETKNAPFPSLGTRSDFSFDGEVFEKFSSYYTEIVYAEGEFPGNTFEGLRDIKITDYIAPPHLLSLEKDDKNATWFRGEYLDYNIIKTMSTEKIPFPKGVGAAQPVTSVNFDKLLPTMFFAILLLVAMQLFFNMNTLDKVVFDGNFDMPLNTASKTFVTPRFTLGKYQSNLELRLYAPVNNTWFEVGVTLVNAKDGTEYELNQGIEYYSGYSEGEAWSEGSVYESMIFSSIPAGTYFMQITGSGDPKLTYGRPADFHIKAINDTTMYRNLWILVIPVVSYGAILALISYYNEKRRWSNSPYSTFVYD